MSVGELLKKRVSWLREHRSEKHAISTENAFNRAIWYAQDWEHLPVTPVDSEMVGEMKSRWAADLAERGKTNVDLNKTLGHLQSAWNHPWDNKRERRTYLDNPFAFTARLPTAGKAKQYPTPDEVRTIPI